MDLWYVLLKYIYITNLKHLKALCGDPDEAAGIWETECMIVAWSLAMRPPYYPCINVSLVLMLRNWAFEYHCIYSHIGIS